MTVKEYIESLDRMNGKFKPSKDGTDIKESMLNSTRIWSNDACKGYALKAMQNSGLKEDLIKAVLTEMSYCFNNITVEEAEKEYINS